MTGDIDSIANANNLAMVALTARMQHEHNYDDDRLAKSNLKRLDIDPATVTETGDLAVSGGRVPIRKRADRVPGVSIYLISNRAGISPMPKPHS